MSTARSPDAAPLANSISASLSLQSHFSDENILEVTYHALIYNLHAVTCRALRLEYDDVEERIREVPMPKAAP
jgi:alkylhydroperoxidase family enzyme